MGWGFRRSVKIAPGVRLNLGKKSASVRFGGRGFGVTKSTTGRTTVSGGIPGTGVYYRETVKGAAPKPRRGHRVADQAAGPDEPHGAEEPTWPGAGTSGVPMAAVAPEQSPKRRPAIWQYVVLAAAVVAMIFSLAGIAGAALMLAGVGLAGWAIVQSSEVKWPLIAAGVALLVAGIGQSSAQAEQRPPVPTPAATVTATVTATPTPPVTPAPTPTPTPTPTAQASPSAVVAPLAATQTSKAATSGSGSSGSGSTSGKTGSSNGGTSSSSVSYANCKAAKAAGAAPLHRGDPGYSSKLDRDGDGVACE
ncbi:DUF4236 domain-containing protein [Raineyella sp.]|uniref:DUF4236 domain-containing protein n=1 Tax=Raineyella sp. TaxID=1911550 RepID=UPI002B204D24|nr:DUF4236 domain-containing protein [Raineyella sp.]MEA5153234.1 DUF4236 domain-containing protein [Raineyella sp.]